MSVGFGFKLPNCGGVLCEPSWATPQVMRRLASRAEILGFDSLWMQDHLLTPRELQHLGPVDFHEPLVTAAHVLSVTQRASVGVATIILPFREPVLLAKQLSTLEALFPHRVVAGFGTGRYESEFDALGVDWKDRGAIADEYLETLVALLRAGDVESVSTDGQRGVTAAQMYPRPPAGSLPMWIGGNVGAALRRSAKFGDGWISAALSIDEAREHIGRLREAVVAHGRPWDGFSVALSLTIRPEASERAGGPELHRHRNAVAGSSDEVTAALHAYKEAGVTDFLIAFDVGELEELESAMAWFAGEIMPALASLPLTNVTESHQ